MSIILETRIYSSQPPSHAPWCAAPSRRHNGPCYSEPIETPVGGVWLSDRPGGAAIIADTPPTLTMPVSVAAVLMAALAELLAQAGLPACEPVPSWSAVVDGLDKRDLLALAAAVTARLAGAR